MSAIENLSQHANKVIRDLATLTSDLRGHGVCRWRVSSYSINLYTKFQIRRSFRSEDMMHLALVDLVTLTLKLMCIIARGVDNLPTNFGVSR